jgi:type II secretory ATPase GspE/PulE/Tfp pilus assembly ATPase PilB-like protein
VPYHIIGTSLRLIIAQNLVRQLCGECAQTRELDETERELFARFGRKAPESLLHPGSCAECNWYGYKGRTGIFEVATIDDEVGRLISVGTRNGELGDCLRSKGLRSMAQDGIEKATKGVTSMEELFRVCGFASSGDAHQHQDATAELEMVTG